MTTWENLGTGGSQYNLIVAGSNNTATFRNRNGGFPAHVAFGATGLQTTTNVPLSLAGNSSRTMGAYFLWEQPASVTIMGYGTADIGRAYDMLVFSNGRILSPHYYGAQVRSDLITINNYVRVDTRMTNTGTSLLFENFINGIPASTGVTSLALDNINTSATPFLMGKGTHPLYNANVPRRIVAAYITDSALSNQQIAYMGAYMMQLKPAGSGVHLNPS